ncbi:MAG: hypothetical protein J5I65_01570 [Aridibacter famidurans]|nr:hypothetical protein [Aridibacter famidurans]
MAIEIEKQEYESKMTVSFQVIEPFKGDLEDTAKVEFPVSECGPGFEINEEYLVYDNFVRSINDNICNWSMSIGQSYQGLAYARRARSGPAQYGLYVTVNGLSSDDFSQGVASIKTGNVTLPLPSDTFGDYSYVTSTTGKFVFSLTFPFDVSGGMQIFNPPMEYFNEGWGLQKFEKEFELKPNECKLLAIDVERMDGADPASD